MKKKYSNKRKKSISNREVLVMKSCYPRNRFRFLYWPIACKTDVFLFFQCTHKAPYLTKRFCTFLTSEVQTLSVLHFCHPNITSPDYYH
ncbi:hypothetical protein CW304_12480 [Bacillus sp. UFRGS-B20]|nr:hypothetical protein CW304_12480 [Bacillus sp. UFRGS-B20]